MNKRIQRELKNLAWLVEDSKTQIALRQEDGRVLPSILFAVDINVGTYKGQKHIVKMDLIWGPDGENVFPNKGMKFPLCHIITPIYHPNVDKAGNICVSILTSEGWNPLYTLETVVKSLELLLQTPNPDSPQWKEPARDYIKMSEEDFARKANSYYREKLDETVFAWFENWTTERIFAEIGLSIDDFRAEIKSREEEKAKKEKEKTKEDETFDELNF